MFIQNGIGYDTPGPPNWSPPTPPTADRCSPSATWSASRTATTRTSGTPTTRSTRSSTRSSRTTRSSTRPTRTTSTAQKQTFETPDPGRVQLSSSRDIKAKYAGTPIGASESIVSPLADALGLNMLTPYSFLKAISEGTDPTAADKADHRPADQGQADQGLRLQQPELHPGRHRPGRRGKAGRDPGHHRHRDPDPGRRHLPGMADRAAGAGAAAGAARERPVSASDQVRRGRGGPSTRRRPGRRAGRAASRVRSERGAAGPWAAGAAGRRAACDLDRRARRRVRRGARAQRRRQVDAGQGAARPAPAAPRARPGARRAARRGQPARSATCRSAAASTPRLRIRGIDVVRLGLDGDRWGVPLPGPARRAAARRAARGWRRSIELVGAERLRPPADRRAAPAASSSAC